MISNENLNDLAEKLSSAIPDGLKSLKSDMQNNMKSVLQSSLQQMNLVSREEFDVQAALLSRTLEKLNQLEKQIGELEKTKWINFDITRQTLAFTASKRCTL